VQFAHRCFPCGVRWLGRSGAPYQRFSCPASEAYARGKVQAKRANSKLKEVAEKQPLALVAGAVAVGALIGSLLPKGRSGEE
jgi:hypothetical protein